MFKSNWTFYLKYWPVCLCSDVIAIFPFAKKANITGKSWMISTHPAGADQLGFGAVTAFLIVTMPVLNIFINCNLSLVFPSKTATLYRSDLRRPLFSHTSHIPAIVFAGVCEITQSFLCTMTFKGRDSRWMFTNSQFIQHALFSLSVFRVCRQMKNIFDMTHLYLCKFAEYNKNVL